MDENALSKLSPEQTAALSDELKAVYTLLSPADQEFFAKTFKPADLPTVLGRKRDILQRSQGERERIQQLQASFAKAEEAHPPVDDKAENVMGAVAGVLGVGAAAAIIATDNTAHYRGVKPQDLLDPLRAEFNAGQTGFSASGRPDAVTATITMRSDQQPIPALTINLNTHEDGIEIKVNDLTSQGLLETVKEGGKKLLNVAQAGLNLINHSRQGGLSPNDIGNIIDSGTGLAEAAGALKLKERAWKVIRAAGESIEAGYLTRLEEERKARSLLEKAWDNTYNCPTCGVAFGENDKQCRVCGTAHPEAPARPDPRKA